MKYTIFLLFILNSCGAWPEFFKTADDIANDTAIKVEVSREAIQKKTNLNLSLDVTNTPKAAS